MQERKNHEPIKGRGAPHNEGSARFNLPQREADGDWLDALPDIDGMLPPLHTTVTIEHPKTIITRNQSPDIGFDRSVNAYRGCEHGCIYCFARPTHTYHDLSPGLDFETQLFVKPEASSLLRTELNKRHYVPRPLAMGTNTDPYQPIEAQWQITRQCIEVLAEARHPLVITTKSNRILRDLDLLRDMARDDLVAVAISVTSLSSDISRTLEPRAPHPEKRLAAVRKLSQAGVKTYVNIAPVVPAITDHELEAIVSRAAEAGACGAFYMVVRLPLEVAPLFRAWLDAHYPERAGKVMAIIRDIRGGRDNSPEFHERMRGQGVWADLFRTRFRKALARYGLVNKTLDLRCDLFRPPSTDQLSLF